MSVRFEPVGPLRGQLAAPPDKSISHRAALLGAMASDPLRIVNYLEAADTLSTLDAVRSLGALVERRADALVIRGTGLRNATEVGAPIDVGNAGTLLRLLPGWLAFQEGGSWVLDGDASIRRRPVDRVIDPLARMGAELTATEGRLPPLAIRGARLSAISYALGQASAQVKSCVALAALGADGETAIVEPAPSRDHTERMLLGAGVSVRREGDTLTVSNCDELVLEEVTVPGDPSSAAFAVVAAVIIPRSRIVVTEVGVNWTRTGLLRILQRMGAIVVGELEPPGSELVAEEPVSDLDVAAAPLTGTEITPDEVGLVIDELPLVALAACFADGETVVRGAQELRVKESDRITAVVEGLRGLGASIEALPDGFVVTGTGGLEGGTMRSHGDHRLAMLGAVAGLASRSGVTVEGMEAADVSYPGFTRDLAALL